MQEAFCVEHCGVFEDTEENKLCYTDIFTRYTEVIEGFLAERLTATIEDFDMEEFKDGLAGELGVMASDITLAFGEGPALQLRAKKAADDDDASFQVTTTIECPDRPTACDIGIKLQALTADLTTLSEILKAEVKHADPPVLPSFCVVPTAENTTRRFNI